MKRALLVLAAPLLLVLGASCDKDQKTAEPTAASASATAAAPTPEPATAAPAAAALAPENIPVAADFEDEAEKTITKANYKAELKTLEAELK